MKHLNYDDFKNQKYLVDKSLSMDEKKLFFKFRTRMCNLGENFRAGKGVTNCPLCSLHPECQLQFLQWQHVREELENNFGGLKNFTDIEVMTENLDIELINQMDFPKELRILKPKV